MKLGMIVKIFNVSDTEEKFKTLINNGFTSCQLAYRVNDYSSEIAKIVKELAEKYNVDISAYYAAYDDGETVWDTYYGYLTAGLNIDGFTDLRIRAIKKHIEFAHLMDVEDVILHAGFIPNNPFEPAYAKMVAAVHSLAVLCKSYNMNLLFETGGEAPISLVRLFEDVGTGNLFVNFDPANILMYGLGNPVDALYVFGKYVRNMHAKDGKLPIDPKMLGPETPVGEGMVDFEGIFKKFRELGYDRYITIEREITGEKQNEDILKAKVYLESMISKYLVN